MQAQPGFDAGCETSFLEQGQKSCCQQWLKQTSETYCLIFTPWPFPVWLAQLSKPISRPTWLKIKSRC
eukprot:1155506-Pelagomonas_calceolata.AAC.11